MLATAGLLLAGTVATGTMQAAQAAGATGYSLHTTYSFDRKVAAASPRWTADLGLPTTETIADRIAVSGDKVYIVKADGITALTLNTGKTLWKYALKNVRGTPQIAGGYLYAASASGKVVKLNASSGKLAWTYQTNSTALPVLLADGDTVFVSGGGWTAIDAATGKAKWRNANAPEAQIPRIQGDLLLLPTWESGAITVSTEYALDRRTGKTLWRLEGSHEYLGTRAGQLYYLNTWPMNDSSKYAAVVDIVDPKTGKVAESRSFLPVDPGKDPLIQNPRQVVLDGDDLLIQTFDGEIVKYNVDTDGTVAPSWTFGDRGTWIAGPYNGRLYLERPGGDEGFGIKAVKLIDRTAVYYEGLDNPVSRLDLIGSGLYVAQTDGQVFALNATTGKALFRYPTSSRSFGPFKVSGKTLLVQSEQKLYAFDLPASVLGTPGGAESAGTWTKVRSTLKIDGTVKPLEPAPMMTDNRLYVPLRPFFEALGGKVAYDGKTGQTTIAYRGQSFALKAGAAYADKGGTRQAMQHAPVTLNGALYVPLREVSGLSGVNVTWDTATRTVEIDTKR